MVNTNVTVAANPIVGNSSFLTLEPPLCCLTRKLPAGRLCLLTFQPRYQAEPGITKAQRTPMVFLARSWLPRFPVERISSRKSLFPLR
jgi:hypothetical protein